MCSVSFYHQRPGYVLIICKQSKWRIERQCAKQLERFILQNPVYENLGLDEEKNECVFSGPSGLSIYELANSSRLCAFSTVPTLFVLVVVGGNDATT